ncbi:MAG: protein kinase [Xanthomonadales bacterium]|nr:protein kinase [Xanthomonadales bacterium]
MAETTGFSIPGYRILRRLGRGGMATVYLAAQESLNRLVAIKILTGGREPDAELVGRFRNEAHTIAQLDHPHIVGIYDVGQTSRGEIYYSMPYLPNGDLASRDLREHPLELLAVVRALAVALGHAHEHGIVHRDVKPENVLFDQLDRPLLADFGIATSGNGHPRITRDGATIGSSGYMSPEQARGQPIDGRSDFYSLGVVCYELLTGELPFRGPDALSIALAHVERPVPRLPLTRRAWQPFIDKAMAKQADARFQSADEVIAALDIVERQLQEPAAEGLSRWWRRIVERIVAVPRGARTAVLAALLLAALAGLVALLPREPERAAAPAMIRPAAAGTGAEPAPAGGAGADTAADAPAADHADQLALAAELLADGHLLAPKGENAAAVYLDVLAAEPGQEEAVAGVRRILERLGATAARAIEAGKGADAVPPMKQGIELGGEAKLLASSAFAAFIAPIRAAVEKRRKQPRGALDAAALADLEALLPTLGRLDPGLAEGVRTDIGAPARLLAEGGRFRDPRGPAMVLLPATTTRAAMAVSVDPVGRADYARFAAATGRVPARCRSSPGLFARSKGLDWRRPGFSQGDADAVTCVSWDDAAAYAEWQGRQSGARYRLPSRQEWLAITAGAGDSCGSACGREGTAPAASLAATRQGVRGLFGNVSQWIGGCAGKGRDGSCAEREYRGRSWHDGKRTALDHAGRADGDIGYATVGFRLVRELPRGR